MGLDPKPSVDGLKRILKRFSWGFWGVEQGFRENILTLVTNGEIYKLKVHFV